MDTLTPVQVCDTARVILGKQRAGQTLRGAPIQARITQHDGPMLLGRIAGVSPVNAWVKIGNPPTQVSAEAVKAIEEA